MSKTKWETLNDAGVHPPKELMLGLLDNSCPFANTVYTFELRLVIAVEGDPRPISFDSNIEANVLAALP